jgi:uncharacterized protein (TIGR00375 family)
MKFVADLHMHSKYSRATSKDMVLEEVDRIAAEKGVTVIGTGDCTHPKWFEELSEKLESAEPGLFRLKKKYQKQTIWGTFAETRFILTGEISSIYSRGGKTRRVHNIILLPSLASAKKLNEELGKRGNIVSDGRPILGIDSEDLAKIIFGVESTAMIIPAHLWTPWFGILGSMSGFDSIEECFGKYTDRIIAVETGLSSDPAMNWQLSKLDGVAMISNSDSHSPQKIGREATMFDAELSYQGIREAIIHGALKNRAKKSANKIVATLEFFPEEGKYFYDGHRACSIVMTPKETKKNKGICPVCKKPVTVGVLNRVEVLADIKHKMVRKGNLCTQEGRVPFYNIIQLDEVIANILHVGVKTKKVRTVYERLIIGCGKELEILLNVPEKELAQHADETVVRGIMNVRKGKVVIVPGYDGEYGKITVEK